MQDSTKALSFEQATNLLLKGFKPIKGRKKLLKTPVGIIAYHYSSLLKNGFWVTSHNEDEIRNEIDFILFALGFEGIIMLSREVLLSFYEKNFKSRFSGNGYPIYIYKKDDRFFWKGEADNQMDVTEFFYPNK